MTRTKAHQKLLQQKLKEGQKFLFAEPPDFSRASIIFQELTRLAPHWSEGHCWLGAARLGESELDAAKAAFRRAVELDSNDSRPHFQLGIIFEQEERLEEAARSFRAGLAMKPHYGEADARMSLAGVLEKMGRVGEAIQEWQTVANMDAMYPSYDRPMQEAKRALQRHGHA